MFVIEFLPKVFLLDWANYDDLPWTPMPASFEDEQAANDNARLLELDDSGYEYRVREVAR